MKIYQLNCGDSDSLGLLQVECDFDGNDNQELDTLIENLGIEAFYKHEDIEEMFEYIIDQLKFVNIVAERVFVHNLYIATETE
jgi:hypothetical protein